jgi:hypothetical protein
MAPKLKSKSVRFRKAQFCPNFKIFEERLPLQTYGWYL